MPVTVTDIRRWCEKAQRSSAKFMVVQCDTFHWLDHPVFCMSDADCLAAVGEATRSGEYREEGGMTKVMEVYDLTADLDEQLAEDRAWRIPTKEAS